MRRARRHVIRTGFASKTVNEKTENNATKFTQNPFLIPRTAQYLHRTLPIHASIPALVSLPSLPRRRSTVATPIVRREIQHHLKPSREIVVLLKRVSKTDSWEISDDVRRRSSGHSSSSES